MSQGHHLFCSLFHGLEISHLGSPETASQSDLTGQMQNRAISEAAPPPPTLGFCS